MAIDQQTDQMIAMAVSIGFERCQQLGDFRPRLGVHGPGKRHWPCALPVQLVA
jgi:hypothetical protein